MSLLKSVPELAGLEPGQLFRHLDGGYYQVVAGALHSDDKTPLVVYRHLWPFERDTWARPAQEWVGRFTRTTQREVDEAMLGNQAAAQAAVTAAKAARRAAAGK